MASWSRGVLTVATALGVGVFLILPRGGTRAGSGTVRAKSAPERKTTGECSMRISRAHSSGAAGKEWQGLAARLVAAVPSEIAPASASEDPVEFGLRLVDRLREDPASFDAALACLVREEREEHRFQIARALNRFQTPGRVRRTVESVRNASPAVRAAGMHALLGRTEAGAVEWISDSYLHDPEPGVRTRAAFALQEIPDLLPESVRDEARRRVRSVEAPDPLLAESLELLASGGATQEDLSLIVGAFHASAAPVVKSAALRALVSGGADPDVLRNVFLAASDDPSLPPELGELSRKALEIVGR